MKEELFKYLDESVELSSIKNDSLAYLMADKYQSYLNAHIKDEIENFCDDMGIDMNEQMIWDLLIQYKHKK